MRKTLQTKCKASVGYSQGIIKGASLNPAAHLYILEYTEGPDGNAVSGAGNIANSVFNTLGEVQHRKSK